MATLAAPSPKQAAKPSLKNSADSAPSPDTCTYKTYEWSVKHKGPVNHRTVTKPYTKVTQGERDPHDPRCTVCSEDQRDIDLGAMGFDGMGTIRVCRYYQDQVAAAFREIADQGTFQLSDAVGYRVGKTRGPLVNHKRTVFSNHAFGTAVDINAKYNGLYSRCDIDTVSVKALKRCKLGIGGAWNPARHPHKTITPKSVVYTAITAHTGWRWGGDISGKIRDLMHFSITGY